MSEAIESQFESQRWAGEMGDKWHRYLDQFESGIEAVGTAAIAAAGLRRGERVLDIGCGGGLTSLAIAALVGPGGAVTGVDISPRLVAAARVRAAAAGAQNLDFVCADAAAVEPAAAPFDTLFSRFGVMFFDDPHAAFRHLHELLRPGGRVLFACWGPLESNPWVTDLVAVARRYVDVPPVDPRRPGPFALGDVSYATDLLETAGFTDVAFEPWRGEQLLGGLGATPTAAAAFVMQTLFIGDMVKGQPVDVQQQVERDLRDVLTRHEDRNAIRLPAMARFISARAG